MTFDYQNLRQDDLRYWSYGRVWLRRAGEWWNRRFGTLRLEWTVPCSHCGVNITIGGGDGGDDLGFTVGIPFLLTLYITFEHAFAKRVFDYDFDRGDEREIGVYYFEGAIWWRVWVSGMGSWQRGAPWCRWYRQGSFHFASLLGRQTYTCVTLQENIPVSIPMPEGIYTGTAKIEERTWKRTLWFAQRRTSTTINMPKGIPFSGKGENSWDCGDDGLFSAGCDGADVQKAITHFAQSVTESRRRYGRPSDASIAEALS